MLIRAIEKRKSAPVEVGRLFSAWKVTVTISTTFSNKVDWRHDCSLFGRWFNFNPILFGDKIWRDPFQQQKLVHVVSFSFELIHSLTTTTHLKPIISSGNSGIVNDCLSATALPLPLPLQQKITSFPISRFLFFFLAAFSSFYFCCCCCFISAPRWESDWTTCMFFLPFLCSLRTHHHLWWWVEVVPKF